MKVLWLSPNSGLMENGATPYNGGGWIAGLQQAMGEYSDVKLALAFCSQQESEFKVSQAGTVYYPIFESQPSAIAKLKKYWGGFRQPERQPHKDEIDRIVEDFQPDVIQIFGTENPLFHYVRCARKPSVVHMQGILCACHEAFFPPGISRQTLLKHGNFVRERILRNGFLFAYDSMGVRKAQEKESLQAVKNLIGRTGWDKKMASLLAPQAEYFHVDEVLRDAFYKAPKWIFDQNRELRIVSTLSETPYKGLDVVLKTAKILKELPIDFCWEVVGISPNSSLVSIFEETLGISSGEVNVRYCGICNSQEIIEKLLSASLYVHPSYIDNSPNSLCEAQLLGVPVAACNVGGVASLIEDGKTGWLVPSNAPFELAYLIRHIRDFNLKEIAEASRLQAETRHDKRKIANDLLSCYRKLTQ